MPRQHPHPAPEAELADYYDRTHDLSGFDLAHPEELEPTRRRRDVTVSVRFSPEEIDLLRDEADRAGMKVTTFIRALCLLHAASTDALTEEWLADPEHAAEMAESRRAIADGTTFSVAEVRETLASRRDVETP